MGNSNPNPEIGLSSATNIAVLFNELLIEIFIRLANHESVITCKLVSKHWLSLLSDPTFLIRYVNHKKKKEKEGLGVDQHHQQVLPWTFITTLRLKQASKDDGEKKLIDDHNKVFDSPTNKSSLNFLPGGKGKYKVAATYKDLVLLCKEVKHKDDPRYYFICNPVTKRWVALPPTPSPAPYDFQRGLDLSPACLICKDPYEEVEEEERSRKRRRTTSNSNSNSNIDDEDDYYYRSVYSFRIIVAQSPRLYNWMKGPFCTVKLIVFCCCSDENKSEWMEIDLRLPLNLHQTWCPRTPFKVKGMVCVCYDEYFGMFDAFFDTTTLMMTTSSRYSYSLEARALPIPPGHCRSTLLECGGRLISVLPKPLVPLSAYHFDEAAGLLQRVYEKDISVELLCTVLDLNQVQLDNDSKEVKLPCWKDCRCTCIDKTGSRCLSVYHGSLMIDVHPTNPQLFYILNTASKVLLLCDTASSSLKNLGTSEILLSDHFYKHSPFHNRLELQYWPTPLPTVLPSHT